MRLQHMLPSRDDILRPSIQSKTAAQRREQHAGNSQPAWQHLSLKGPLRYLSDRARYVSSVLVRLWRRRDGRCAGMHGRRHAPALGERRSTARS